jgi:2-methylisocitrate lyase-like PEP mutase family enzyme
MSYSRKLCDARLYLQAGADCVFPMRLADDELIGKFVRRVECW